MCTSRNKKFKKRSLWLNECLERREKTDFNGKEEKPPNLTTRESTSTPRQRSADSRMRKTLSQLRSKPCKSTSVKHQKLDTTSAMKTAIKWWNSSVTSMISTLILAWSTSKKRLNNAKISLYQLIPAATPMAGSPTTLTTSKRWFSLETRKLTPKYWKSLSLSKKRRRKTFTSWTTMMWKSLSLKTKPNRAPKTLRTHQPITNTNKQWQKPQQYWTVYKKWRRNTKYDNYKTQNKYNISSLTIHNWWIFKRL